MIWWVKLCIAYIGLHAVIGAVNILRCEYALLEEEEYEKTYTQQHYFKQRFSFQRSCPLPGYGITYEVIEEEEKIYEAKRRYENSRASAAVGRILLPPRIEDEPQPPQPQLQFDDIDADSTDAE